MKSKLRIGLGKWPPFADPPRRSGAILYEIPQFGPLASVHAIARRNFSRRPGSRLGRFAAGPWRMNAVYSNGRRGIGDRRNGGRLGHGTGLWPSGLQRPLKYHAKKPLAGRDRGVMPLKFGQQFGPAGKTISQGIGLSQLLNSGQLLNFCNQHFTQAGCETDLPNAHNGPRPEANGLTFFSGTHQVHKMFLQQQHRW